MTRNCSFAIIITVTKYAPVAQGIEQRFPKPQVGRSIRLGRTSKYKASRFLAWRLFSSWNVWVVTKIHLQARAYEVVYS